MADFVKEHKKNVRFSVNRNQTVQVKVSKDENDCYLKLVSVLQERRNTGPAVETMLYLIKKYFNQKPVVKGLKRNKRGTVLRDTKILFKVSETEKALWDEKLKFHGGSSVECFMDMINAEFTFQDKLEIIMEQ